MHKNQAIEAPTNFYPELNKPQITHYEEISLKLFIWNLQEKLIMSSSLQQKNMAAMLIIVLVEEIKCWQAYLFDQRFNL